MATHLQQLLRSLCWDSEWNYAVFWKLKHRARMVLTWEDAYCNNHFKNDSEGKDSVEVPDVSHDGHLAHDPLGLAVAKMSYHVYSFGEGIVGRVAATGKHQWIFADDHAMHSGSLLELCDGWQAQFLAGIKTIAVVAAAPHGVVQLGSLNKVNEDPKLLSYIRALFPTLQGPSYFQDPLKYSLQNVSPMSGMSARTSGQDMLQEYLRDVDEAANTCIKSSAFPSPQTHSNDACGSSLPGVVIGDNAKLIQSITESMSQFNHTKSTSVETQPEFSGLEAMDNLNSSFLFSAGSELHEVLGPAFVRQYYPSSRKVEKPDNSYTSQTPEVTESSLLTADTGSDHLLEAVVANFCHKDDTFRSAKSFTTSESMLTCEKMPKPSISNSQTIGSSSYSIGCSSLLEESRQSSFNCLDSCSIRSSTSACRPSEPAKPNKKRARPGESSRPRPRDRQLIQDRIKELRELVPNGAKCSIDSLLERTIRHMVFMQSVTKHADKLSKCGTQRAGNIEMGVLAPGYEQGSSWAVEVGGHMKICPILVENLNTNGQMVIEMLCDDCDNFLEIAEAIRSLGLTIVKGITDNQGDKTWMRFVVEGQSQSNRNLHRMDVLCSLVQILQSKSTI